MAPNLHKKPWNNQETKNKSKSRQFWERRTQKWEYLQSKGLPKGQKAHRQPRKWFRKSNLKNRWDGQKIRVLPKKISAQCWSMTIWEHFLREWNAKNPGTHRWIMIVKKRMTSFPTAIKDQNLRCFIQEINKSGAASPLDSKRWAIATPLTYTEEAQRSMITPKWRWKINQRRTRNYFDIMQNKARRWKWHIWKGWIYIKKG